MKNILLACALSLSAFCVYADQQDEPKEQEVAKSFVIPDKSSGKCVPTPGLNQADHYPGKAAIVTNNNLVLPTGKAVYAKGQILNISGRVLDKNCVPVSDAVIDIWQTDMEGKYITSTANERANPYPHFTGSGRAVTDNMGHYSFTTVFPGVEYSMEEVTEVNDKASPKSKEKADLKPKTVEMKRVAKAPAINVRITHLNFNAFNTKIYFEKDARNSRDALFASLSPWWQNQVIAQVTPLANREDGIAIYKDIILSGKNPYRKY